MGGGGDGPGYHWRLIGMVFCGCFFVFWWPVVRLTWMGMRYMYRMSQYWITLSLRWVSLITLMLIVR